MLSKPRSFTPAYWGDCPAKFINTCFKANSVCVCEDDECEADAPKVPTESDGMCICAFDRLTQDAWPCHPKAIWQNTTCQFCDDHMFCQKYSKNGERQNEPCLCGNGEAFCMIDRMAKLLNLWEFFGELSKVTDVTDDEIEALGFGNMTDEVAIVTKAKENIIFAMSAVSEQQRRDMSQAKHNLIHKCSFNGKPCDIDSQVLPITMHFVTNSSRISPSYGNG
ncbi:hypothetical protein OSTOST_25912 [Ostertagia ostertagi]